MEALHIAGGWGKGHRKVLISGCGVFFHNKCVLELRASSCTTLLAYLLNTTEPYTLTQLILCM